MKTSKIHYVSSCYQFNSREFFERQRPFFLKIQGWPPLKESQKFPEGENTISYKRRLLWNKDNPGKRKLNSVSTVKREPVLANTIFVLDSFLVVPRGKGYCAFKDSYYFTKKERKKKKEEEDSGWCLWSMSGETRIIWKIRVPFEKAGGNVRYVNNLII